MKRMSKPQFTSTVAVRHLPEQSDPQAGQHAFAYTVTIRNSGDVTGQLIARHWVITDANGQVEQVRGLAVVGHQPVIKPGESFEYTSWCVLGTPSGEMRGTYQMVTDSGQQFDADIAPFRLNLPQTLN